MVLTEVETAEECRWDAGMDGVVGWYLSPAALSNNHDAAVTSSYCQYH